MQANKFTVRILTITMAFLVLLSSIGFTMDMHFCQGILQHVSFSGEAKSCHEIAAQNALSSCCKKKQKTACQKSNNNVFKEACDKNCCSNQTINVTPNTDLSAAQIAAPDLKSIQWISHVVKEYSFQAVHHTLSTPLPQNYKPPLLDKDILRFIQCFLL